MDFSLSDETLRRIASDPSFTGGYAGGVADLFRQTLQIVAAVPDESDLREFRCLKYSNLRGRGSRRKIALTEGAYLTVRIENGKPRPEMIVEQIVCNGRKK